MKYYYPFGEVVHPLVQTDRSPKQFFVLGVYASAVHARWLKGNKVVSAAIAVASEPRIFWNGNPEEATEIISRIHIPEEMGTLEPAGSHLNGPSAKVLDNHILAPLGFTRKDAWLCDLLPETRLNRSQQHVIKEKYRSEAKKYGLNDVNIPPRPVVFCDKARCAEIVTELEESHAETLILLGDIPIRQFLNKVADVRYKNLQDYVDMHGYGKSTPITIDGKGYKVLPLAHPRQIGALGYHSSKWHKLHQEWEDGLK